MSEEAHLARALVRDLREWLRDGDVIYSTGTTRDWGVNGDTKPTNPKDAIGSNKVPLHLWPETATVLGTMALLDGALKYGRSNYRAVGVRASIYYDAARRHLTRWFEGEDLDPDSGLPHLAHALASIAIVVDAQQAGKLRDDRNIRGGFANLLETMTLEVTRLKAKHAGRDPKHYTIEDDPDEAERAPEPASNQLDLFIG